MLLLNFYTALPPSRSQEMFTLEFCFDYDQARESINSLVYDSEQAQWLLRLTGYKTG